jgi:hypothetical protein
MQIHNLTSEQVEMLDQLWAFDTLEEIEDFKSQLPLFRRQQIDTLLEMVRLQGDDDWIDENDYGVYPAAKELFRRIRKTG